MSIPQPENCDKDLPYSASSFNITPSDSVDLPAKVRKIYARYACEFDYLDWRGNQVRVNMDRGDILPTGVSRVLDTDFENTLGKDNDEHLVGIF